MDDLYPDQQVTEQGVAINLDSLRTELAQRLSLLLIVSGGLGLWLCIALSPFPITLFGLLTLLVAHCVVVRKLLPVRPILGRRLLVVGLTIILVVAMIVLDEPWMPFLGLLLVFASAVLSRHSEIFVSTVVCIAILLLNVGLGRDYPLPDLIVLLVFCAIFAGLVSNAVYTALSWESQTRQHSYRLLSEIREHRGQLSQSVKSLNQAYELQKRTQQELVQARKVAEEARRLKEQFAANISHELRTPLNLVLGFTEVMYRNPEVYGDLVWPLKLRRDISQVYRNTHHLVDMIDDILDLSRIEITSFSLHIEPTPLTPLILEVARIADDIFHHHAARFVVDVPPDLPTVEVDRTRVRQVLLNLLNNAARFTERGSVRLIARHVNDEIVVQVKDTGIGIPADKLPHLFSEFFQVDSSVRRSRSGAGLGLAISKRFVEAHGGRIWAESVSNQGTTFSFTLPVDGMPLSVSRANPDPQEVRLQRHPLLLVDVEPVVAAHLARYLKDYDLVTVHDPGEIEAVVKSWAPSAILWNSTGQRPDENATVSAIPIPVIECPLTFLQDDLPRSSLIDLLPKPITSEQLLKKIDLQGNVNHILVIDDDIGFTQLIERFIEVSARQYTIAQAYTGNDGLIAMQAHLPDLVLLDVSLPDLSGLDVLNLMNQDDNLQNIPVILLTAREQSVDSDSIIWGPIRIHSALGFKPGELMHLLGKILSSLSRTRSG